jgi:hypothetical protein
VDGTAAAGRTRGPREQEQRDQEARSLRPSTTAEDLRAGKGNVWQRTVHEACLHVVLERKDCGSLSSKFHDEYVARHNSNASGRPYPLPLLFHS